jgi:uncharacterized membrane protein YqjE
MKFCIASECGDQEFVDRPATHAVLLTMLVLCRIALLAYDLRLAIVALPTILFGAGAAVCVWMIRRSRKSSLTCH